LKYKMRIATVTIILNVLLSFIKFIIGVIGHSGAMISDGVHSMSDVISTFIVIVGIKISAKKPDKNHPYGHERMEAIATVVLSSILFITGGMIGISGIKTILFHHITTPSVSTLWVALFSILLKEMMFRYTRNGAKKYHSDILMADAWHHRSDALSSVGAFIGIGGSLLGYPVLEPLASIFICFMIMKASVDIFMESSKKLVDQSADEKLIQNIKKTILNIKGVLFIDTIRTRMVDHNKYYVDVEISVDGNISLYDAHQIAHNVHDTIEDTYAEIKHIMIHVNPESI